MLGAKKKIVARYLPLAMILCGLFCFFYFRLDQYISFQCLKAHREFLTHWTHDNYFFAVCIYMLFYVITILCAIPGSLFFLLTAGFLFGAVYGFIYAMVCSIVGAMLFFLIVKAALADWLLEKWGDKLQHFEEGFQENAFHYILTMRLVPVLPFFVVNIASAILGVRLSSFLAATFLGIIPATGIYVSLGQGLGKIFDHHKMPSKEILFQPHIFMPLMLLALFAIIPVLYKKMK